MVEVEILDDIKVVKKEVDNILIYHQLKYLNISSVPRIIDIQDNIVFYEYIEGETLYELINSNYFSEFERIIIGEQLIHAIKNINEKGIIHKDIKPENIIVTNDNKIFLIDFEGSRVYDNKKSRDTILLGTQGYASPEHYGYTQTTFKSDMYSLGKVLSDLKLPSIFDTLIDKCTKINHEERYDNYLLLLNTYKELTNKELKRQSENKIDNKSKTFFLYNYDNSKKQKIFTIIFTLIYIVYSYIFIIESKLTFDYLLQYIVVLVLVYIYCIYIIDIIRITYKKIIAKEKNYKKYIFTSIAILILTFNISVLLTGIIMFAFNRV